MATLASNLMELAGKLPEGVPVSAKELLHLGSRAAVDQALSRLVKRGQLVRAGRGLYLLPVKGRFGVRYPEASRFVETISEQRGESVAPQGAAAANLLGLTTQVPDREVYITSGRGRKLTLGGQVIEMRRAPAWQLMFPGRLAGTQSARWPAGSGARRRRCPRNRPSASRRGSGGCSRCPPGSAGMDGTGGERARDQCLTSSFRSRQTTGGKR